MERCPPGDGMTVSKVPSRLAKRARMWAERYAGAGEDWDVRAASGEGAPAASTERDIAVWRAQRKGRVAVEAARLLQRRWWHSEHWVVTCSSYRKEEQRRHGMKGHGAHETSISSGEEMFYVA